MTHYFLDDPTLADDYRDFMYYYGETSFVFTSNSGVFSHGGVDEATNLLIKNIPPLRGSLLDLGCGYGAIGIVLAKMFALTLTQSDVNPRALRLAEKNCAQNNVAATVLLSDCFANIGGKFDAITLNPPIHAGKSVVYALFEGAKAHLNAGGRFYVVMLEKHGAKTAAKKLTELFGNCGILCRKKGVFVFEMLAG
ncbi:MAG: methyltransferase [Oscillospiraceae bacterium]|jgi:16S rRNA (guanine1207-N2)-methyltransferase|nr:methyltransferase [Oscillospiraceae bacterium]